MQSNPDLTFGQFVALLFVASLIPILVLWAYHALTEPNTTEPKEVTEPDDLEKPSRFDKYYGGYSTSSESDRSSVSSSSSSSDWAVHPSILISMSID